MTENNILNSAKSIAQILEPACKQVKIAGSIRRHKADPNDIEIVAIPIVFDFFDDFSNALLWLTDKLLETGSIELTEKKCWGEKHRKFIFEGFKVDLFTADESSWGFQYWLRTGPADSNEYVMKKNWQKKAPWKARGGYIWHGDEKLHVPDEEAFFQILGIPYIAPHNRFKTTYQSLLDSPLHKWGTAFSYVKHMPVIEKVEIENLPAQKPLFELNALHNEHYVDAGVPKAKPPTPPYQWDAPFVLKSNTNWVWVDMGHGDWSLYKRGHSRARQMLSVYQNPHFSKAMFEGDKRRCTEFQNLISHRAKNLSWDEEAFQVEGYFDKDKFLTFVRIPWNSHPSAEPIKINSIVPTQNIVIRKHLQKWSGSIAKGIFIEDDDELPVVMKFSNDPRYFMTDGHHRLEVYKTLGMCYIPCYVDYVDIAFTDALVSNHKKYMPVKPGNNIHQGYAKPELYEIAHREEKEVTIADLIYTADDVEVVYLEKYFVYGKATDSNGELPEVIETSDGKYILLDGHHRAEAAKLKRHKTIRAMVGKTNMSSYRAVVENDFDEDEVGNLISNLCSLYSGSVEVKHAATH